MFWGQLMLKLSSYFGTNAYKWQKTHPLTLTVWGLMLSQYDMKQYLTWKSINDGNLESSQICLYNINSHY